MRVIVIGIVFITSALFSCNSSDEDEKRLGVLNIEVNVKACVSLLPDFTYNYLNGSGYSLSRPKGDVLASCISGGQLFAFDVESGKMIEKKELVRQGPLSVGQVSIFDAVIYLDSTDVIYANHSENKILHLGKDSVKIIADFSGDNTIRIGGTSQNPPIEARDYFLFPAYPGVIDKLSEKPAFVAVSKDLKEHRRVIAYPQAYRENFYGATPYIYWPSIVYNDKRNTYIVSFPVDHNLYEYDEDFNLIKTHVVFHDEMGVIFPYSKPLNEAGMPDWQEDRAYFRTTNQFTGLFFLADVDQYVRVARIPDPLGEGPNSYLLFVYNSDLSKYKNLKMSSDYQMSNVFASDSSIYFLNESRLENERTVELPFDCIAFREID